MTNNPAILAAHAPEILAVGLRCERNLLWSGLETERVEAEPVVNVERELTLYDVPALDWRGGDPTFALALEVLDRYLPPALGSAYADEAGRPVHTSGAALFLHRDFAQLITDRVDYWGGQISREAIVLWILQRGFRPAEADVGAWPPSRMFLALPTDPPAD